MSKIVGHYNRFILSIIIPHKNSPELLQQMLESIPHIPEIQIIIVDDNSDFIDFNSLPGLNNPNTQCIFSKKENGGSYYARNLGLQYALGKWVTFFDADDIAVTEELESLVKKVIPENYDIILWNIHQTHLDGKISKRLYSHESPKGIFADYKFQSLMKPVTAYETWTRMIRRDFLLTHKLSFKEYPISADQFFCAQLMVLHPKIGTYSTTIYHYINRKGSCFFSDSKEKTILRHKIALETDKLLLDNGFKAESNASLFLCNCLYYSYPLFLNECRKEYKYIGFINSTKNMIKSIISYLLSVSIQ